MAGKTVAGSLDTNILLRLLLGDVADQTSAVDKLLESGGKFEIADAALIELVFVLEKIYKFERSLIGENILGIVRNQQFICNRELFERAVPLYLENNRLSIMDSALLIYARLNRATPLFSFDKDSIKLSAGDAQAPL